MSGRSVLCDLWFSQTLRHILQKWYIYLYVYISINKTNETILLRLQLFRYITYFVDWSEEVQSTETAVTVTE